MATKSTVQSALTSRAATLEFEIERLQQQLDFVNSVPQDEYENGAVLVFQKQFSKGGIKYTYACVKGAGSWFVTGRVGSMSWDELMDMLYARLASDGVISGFWVSEISEIL